MINHLIVGNGRWGKKVFKYLKKKRIYKNIYIKSSKKFFLLYPIYKKLNFRYLRHYISKADTAHICTPKNSHLKYLKAIKTNIILEKPIVSANKKNGFKTFKNIISKKKEITLVNYIDLFNNKIKKIKKYFKQKNTLSIYYSKNEKYKNLNEFLDDWLDHPLSIILYLFKKFSKFKITLKIYKKKPFSCYFALNYKIYNSKILIILSNYNKKNIRFLKLSGKKRKIFINFKKINAFKHLYSNLLKKKKNLFHQKTIFHKKLYYEKVKIILQANKQLKN